MCTRTQEHRSGVKTTEEIDCRNEFLENINGNRDFLNQIVTGRDSWCFKYVVSNLKFINFLPASRAILKTPTTTNKLVSNNPPPFPNLFNSYLWIIL